MQITKKTKWMAVAVALGMVLCRSAGTGDDIPDPFPAIREKLGK
jgi:hypothetical protein